MIVADITLEYCLKAFFGYMAGWIGMLAGSFLLGLLLLRAGLRFLDRKDPS